MTRAIEKYVKDHKPGLSSSTAFTKVIINYNLGLQ
jgi:hypothetical protein